MPTHPSSTPPTQPPNLPRDAWALILLILIFTLADAGRVILIARAPAQAVTASLTHVPLPAGQCFAPQPGDVLHITVVAHDLTARDLTVTCLQAGPPPAWSRYP